MPPCCGCGWQITATPRGTDVAPAASWHRLRSPEDLGHLDPGLEGWDATRAYEEMKDYDFYTRFGHKAMKRYVFDYFRDIGNKRTESQTAEPVNQ